MKFDYEVKILELQIKLQPSMPPEVQEQRQRDLSAILKGIANTVEGCGQLLDDTMQIWELL